MNYIFLDLEWNNAFSRKHKKFINEIIEIGAVKLDESLNEIDSFSILISSQLTKKLRGHFKKLTNISNEEMNAGVSFKQAIDEYAKWANAADSITFTWSNSDIYALLDNLSLFLGINKIPFIDKYVDLQKYVQADLKLNGFDSSNQLSLLKAAEIFGLTVEDFELHRAKDDSRICAELFRLTFDKDRLVGFIEDTNKPDYYERLIFKPYIISNIKSPYINKSQLKVKCDTCGQFARRKSKFIFKNHSFYAFFSCGHCKKDFVAFLTFKKHYDHVTRKVELRPVAKSIKQ
ncbi:MAG TPA: exonuclease domain-containing protein [Clostridiales bacterium]|nr:exonuclease domain-containing protein [Clostridiales bacterium]